MPEQSVLPIQELREAIAQGIIASPGDPIPRANLQPPAWICGSARQRTGCAAASCPTGTASATGWRR